MSDATFELVADEDGWRWRLVHLGTVLAESPDSYPSKAKAWQRVRRVKERAPDAAVEQRDRDADPGVTDGDPPATDDPNPNG